MRISDWSSDVCSSDLFRCETLALGLDLRRLGRLLHDAFAAVPLLARETFGAGADLAGGVAHHSRSRRVRGSALPMAAPTARPTAARRGSGGRRGGKEGGSKGRTRWLPSHEKHKNITKTEKPKKQ